MESDDMFSAKVKKENGMRLPYNQKDNTKSQSDNLKSILQREIGGWVVRDFLDLKAKQHSYNDL